MQLVTIVCASVMLPVLAGVGYQIVQFRQQVMRGPQCEGCPLYKTACKIADGDEACDDETEAFILTAEMAIQGG